MVSHHSCELGSGKCRTLAAAILMVLASTLLPLLALPQTAGTKQNVELQPAARHGSGCGTDGQILFNLGGGCGGDFSLMFNYTNKIFNVGPPVTAYQPFSSTPIAVPTLQISTGTPFLFQPGFRPALNGGETLYTGIGWSSTFTDNAPPYGNATQGMDVPLNIYKGYSPSTPGPSAYVLGANIPLGDGPVLYGGFHPFLPIAVGGGHKYPESCTFRTGLRPYYANRRNGAEWRNRHN